MKTSFKLTILLVTTLFSCSSNDNSVPSTANTLILPKKITEINYQGGSVNTYVNNFVFENDILKSTSYGTDRRYDFVYNGDKIVEMKRYVSGVASGSIVFNYIGDKLNYVLNTQESTKTEYSYSGNVLSRITNKSINGGTETIDNLNDITFNSSNNISQEIFTSYYMGNTHISRSTFSYDSKNTPSSNLNKYLKLIMGTEAININNYTTNSTYSPSTNTTPSSQTTYQITYNSNNYPTKIIKTNTTTGALVSDTTIEYY